MFLPVVWGLEAKVLLYEQFTIRNNNTPLQNKGQEGSHLKHKGVRLFPSQRKRKGQELITHELSLNTYHVLKDGGSKIDGLESVRVVSFKQLARTVMCAMHVSKIWIMINMYSVEHSLWLAIYLGEHGTRLKKVNVCRFKQPLILLIQVWNFALHFNASKMRRVQYKVERALKSMKLMKWDFLTIELQVHEKQIPRMIKRIFNSMLMQWTNLLPKPFLTFFKSKFRIVRKKGRTIADLAPSHVQLAKGARFADLQFTDDECRKYDRCLDVMQTEIHWDTPHPPGF